jgi:hypothetical protein
MKPGDGLAALAIALAGCHAASNTVHTAMSVELEQQSPDALIAGEVMASTRIAAMAP